jgi:lipopolysaccharide transport system ATP-binding protein
MNKPIVVKGVSKQFQIGKSKTMLREVLVNFLKNPFRRRDIKGETMWALKGVSFAVEEGEIVGIIGRNGAGKSTLLKVLSKITYPTSGEIIVRGVIGSLLEVGTGFHEELTGRENIYLNGSILGMTKKEINRKLDEIIAFADVERFIDTPIKHYSSGMRLRLGFSVAAHLDTNILLVDEVLAVGDVGFQKKCVNKMGDLRQGGRTILFVSHDMAAVENLCSRAIWIDDGQIRKDGNTQEVIKDYMATFAGVAKDGFDLRGIKNRIGNGWVRYTGIEFLDKKRQPVDVIRSGDGLVVRLYYHAEKRVTNNICFGFQVFTDLGTLVTVVDSSFAGNEISVLPEGDGHVEAEIDFLNLMPARYTLSLWIDNNSGLIYECLEHSVKLDIEVRDFYKSGLGITSRHGIMFLPYKWSLDGLRK